MRLSTVMCHYVLMPLVIRFDIHSFTQVHGWLVHKHNHIPMLTGIIILYEENIFLNKLFIF